MDVKEHGHLSWSRSVEESSVTNIEFIGINIIEYSNESRYEQVYCRRRLSVGQIQ